MVDQYDDGRPVTPRDLLSRLNIRKIPKRKTAVALEDGSDSGGTPRIMAAGRGIIAEEIVRLAHENGINVREDSALAEMLAKIELDSPIPSEAFMAVAEILTYVYKANGQPNPYDAVLGDGTHRAKDEAGS